MIHTEEAVIKPATLALLRGLQSDERLKDHFLVGGTALALLFGHRHSIDLDLFTREKFDEGALEVYLQEVYEFNTTAKFANTLMGFVGNVKVDFITHAAVLVKPFLEPEGLRLADPLDIAAMKLNAISQSGRRQKDFYDLYFLLEHYSLANMLAAYEEKYPRSNPMIPLKSVACFDEIGFDHEPPTLLRKVTFKQVRKRLEQAVNDASRLF